MTLTSAEKSLALGIFDVGAFQDKRQSPDGVGFKLKLHEKQPNAPLSPFYLNLRTPDNPKPGPLTPELVTQIGEVLYSLAYKRGLTFTCVAGLPNAGDPLALAVAEAYSQKYGSATCVIKLKKESTKGQRQITEVVGSTFGRVGDHVLVIDDLITKADTKLEGIAALEQANLKVRDVVVLLDRQQGGSKQLADRGYRLHALFTIEVLLRCYLDEGRITLTLHEEITKYLQAS